VVTWEGKSGESQLKGSLGKRLARPHLNKKELPALFTTAKLWKQSRCPTTSEQIKKMWYLYTMEFYSATKE
jgi:hypothetical protein